MILQNWTTNAWRTTVTDYWNKDNFPLCMQIFWLPRGNKQKTHKNKCSRQENPLFFVLNYSGNQSNTKVTGSFDSF